MQELTLTIDAAAWARLEATAELMIRGEPSLSIDDCINAIFMIGLVHVHSTLSLTYLRKGMTDFVEVPTESGKPGEFLESKEAA